MNLFQAVILAIVQGVTEWFPVSSSGHLAIFQYFFGLKENVTYDVILHLASLVVIIIFFHKEILEIIKDVFVKKDFKYLFYMIIATIPAIIVGLLLKDIIDKIFDSLLIVGLMLIITSFILFFAEKINSKNNKENEKKLTWKNSFLIGLFQAAAIMPGLSRSGSTIGGGMICGIKKEDVVKFSFLIAIPALLGATVLNISEIKNGIDFNMIIGFFVTVIVSFFFLKILINIVKKNKLRYFSYYCFIVGIIVVLYYLFY